MPPVPPILYAHPFSSYCQKVLIALYETQTAFALRLLDPQHPEHGAALAALTPAGKFPVLVADGHALLEASIIVEWIDQHRPPTAAPLIPADPVLALDVRMRDRIFDAYVMTPMQALVADARRPLDARDPPAAAAARDMLDRAYAWLDEALRARRWAAGEAFGLADCAAAPALFYADWVHPIPASRAILHAYRARLLARPAVARVVDEARPYRQMFPLPER